MRRKISSVAFLLVACSFASITFGTALINRQEIAAYFPIVFQSANSETSTADKKVPIHSPSKSETPSPAASSDRDAAESANANKIPIQVSYLFLFKKVVSLDKKATEEETQGKDGKILRQHYKNKAKLTDEQNAALFKTAKECIADVSKKDDEAKKIIDKFRAKYPGGKINKDEPLPTPPAELTVLQEERDAIILRYLDVLKESFGEADFAKFQQFVEADITSHITPTNFINNPLPETEKDVLRRKESAETSSDSNTNQLKEQK